MDRFCVISTHDLTANVYGLEMPAIYDLIGDIDTSDHIRIDSFQIFRNEGASLKCLPDRCHSICRCCLEREDEVRCFFLGNTTEDHTRISAVDTIGGGFGSVDKDLPAARLAGVNLTGHEVLVDLISIFIFLIKILKVRKLFVHIHSLGIPGTPACMADDLLRLRVEYDM